MKAVHHGAILLALTLLAPASRAASEKLALTISGGVSLGNYEAGLTWTVVQYLRTSSRDLELAAVTGASAGSLNALLAAALWCEDAAEARDANPDSNLFHDAWTPVGIEDLLPEAASGYRADDALLTAAPLEAALERIRARLFEPGGRRFRPGCSVPLGFTVTRDQPEERVVSGLSARTQRFVVPLRFAVDAAGVARVVRHALPSDRDSAAAQLLLAEVAPPGGVGPLQSSQAVLASGAFPFAFRARELCDCALRCPAEQTVHDGRCEGPDAAHPLAGLSCARVTPAAPRKLCRRKYVDGGIFDNAPIGLTVDLTELSGARSAPFAPILYLMIDPDLRRFAPAPSMRDGSAGMVGPAQLIGNLVGTARETELARAIRDERWQRTTQGTLAEAAALNAEALAVQEQMRRIAGGEPEERTSMRRELLHSQRGQLGRFLLRCLGEMRIALRKPEPGEVACAEPLRDGTAGARETSAARLLPAEVATLAEAVASGITGNEAQRERAFAEMGDPATPLNRRLLELVRAHDVSTIVQATFLYLVGEVPGLSGAGLGDQALIALRRNLLSVARVSSAVSSATAAMLRAFVAAVLVEEGSGAMSAPAAAAHAALMAGLDPAMEGPQLLASADASDRVAALVALAPRLREMAARAAAITASVDQLASGEATERQLILSRRFPPLGGGQLFNFSGFLDRGLRELDFYLGVYDSVAQIARRLCQRQGPYAGERPAPAFRSDAPLELDLSTPETQRCLGGAMRTIFTALQLGRSPHASFAIARLARLELSVQVGSRAAADQLMEDPAWAWLREPPLPERDPIARGLVALTSHRAPCNEGDAERLCLADPTFDELLDTLRANGYTPGGAVMQKALDDRARFASRLVGQILDRSATVELYQAAREGRAPSDLFLLGTGLGELWSRRAQALSGSLRLEIDPSSIPLQPLPGGSFAFPWLAHLLPYRVSLDVARGGIGFSWLEPALRITPWLSVDSIADLLEVDSAGKLSSSLGPLPTLRLGDVALSAGARWSIAWSGAPVAAPGILGRLALLQERLAISGGIRSVSAGQRAAFITLSVSDLNGIAYWLTPWGKRPK